MPRKFRLRPPQRLLAPDQQLGADPHSWRRRPIISATGSPCRATIAAAATVSRNEYSRILDDPDEQFAVKHDHETTADGANLRDVWTGPALDSLSREELIGLIRGWDDGTLPDVFKIAAEPLKEKHYAAFPSELVLRCIRAGTSLQGYCPTCGKPWCRVIETP